jgi:hypothetical protein
MKVARRPLSVLVAGKETVEFSAAERSSASWPARC